MSLDAQDLCEQLKIEIQDNDAVKSFTNYLENLHKAHTENETILANFIAEIDAIFGRKSDEDKTNKQKLQSIANVVKYYKMHDDKKAFSIHLLKILIPAMVLLIIALVATMITCVKISKRT